MNMTDMVTELVTREGGYTNNPVDKGGPTKYGITEQVARAFGYTGNMEDLPLQTAQDIYTQRYWYQPKFAEVSTVSPAIAEELLDTGVNMGPSTAGKFLQRALNVLNMGGAAYPDITVDGNIGAMTLAALKFCLAKRGTEGEKVLLRMLNAQQSVRYIELAENTPSQETFEYGWQLNRVGSL